jgi:hypothetical protein
LTTDQAAPAADNPQAARWARREPLLHLLSRMQRGVLLDSERALLRAAIEAELADGDQAHAQAERVAERLIKARQQRDHHRAVAEGLRRSIAFIAAGRLNVDVWARIGMALGWTPERAGTECRKRRLHGEQQLAATADSLRQQLAAARAEAEGLAETMRNTDRLNSSEAETMRATFCHALDEPRGRAWGHLAERARAVNAHRNELIKQRDEAREELLDARNIHEGARLTMACALGLDDAATWAAIGDRARKLHPEIAGKGRTASDVLVEHDVTRKAMCDALGAGYHLNWQQIIDTAQRSHNANAEWQREAEALRQQHDRHRHTLAVVLDLDAGTEWPTIVQQAGAARAYRADWARCREEAERSASADVAAARQAEEQAGATLTLRHQQLATALHCDTSTSWRDLIQLAGDRTGLAAAMRLAVTRAEQNATAARQAEAEAVRARQAAEAQRRDVVALLNDTERQLGEARRKAEVWRVDAATQGQIVKQCTEERDRHAATIERMKRTNRMVNGGARDARERAERAESTLAAVSRQCEDWAKPSTALTFESKRRDAAVATVAGILLDLIRTEGRAEHTCPDGEPCPAHDQPAEARRCVVCGHDLPHPQGWYLNGEGPWCTDCKPAGIAEAESTGPTITVTLHGALTPEQMRATWRGALIQLGPQVTR